MEKYFTYNAKFKKKLLCVPNRLRIMQPVKSIVNETNVYPWRGIENVVLSFQEKYKVSFWN